MNKYVDDGINRKTTVKRDATETARVMSQKVSQKNLWGGGTKARNIVVATRRSPKQWTQKSSEQRLSKVFCKVGFLLFPFFLLSCVGKVALVVC